MRSVFSLDGSQWMYGDAFGVLRLGLTKPAKLKNTSKVTAPLGGVSMNAAGTLALVAGRVQTSAYGSPGNTLVGLPGVGIREKIGGVSGDFALMTSAAGDRAVRLHGDTLDVHVVNGAQLVAERAIKPKSLAAKTLDAIALGPVGAGEGQCVLCVLPDGRFVALGLGVLYAGKIGGDASADEVWWALPVSVHPTAAVTLEITASACWIAVHDPAADVVSLAGVSPDGAVQRLEAKSLGPVAVSDAFVVTQPESGALVKRSLVDGSEQRIEVGAWNAHPAEAPEDIAFPHGRPAAPTRLPGCVAARGDEVLFVPWHGEVVVDVTRQATHARGLDPAVGPFRRLILEEFARMNEALRALGLEVSLASFEPHPKQRSAPFGWALPAGRRDLAGLLATQHVRNLIVRSEARTHGWNWGAFGSSGAAPDLDGPADLASTRAGLAWMRAHNLFPLEAADAIADRYDRTMGIPSEAQPSSLPFTPEGERLWVRALLETVRAGRWPDGGIPASWETEPVTSAVAVEALAGLARWPRWRPYEGVRMIAKALAHHLGVDAQPALLALMLADGAPFNWKQYRDAGEALVWLCHAHPELAASSLAAAEGAKPSASDDRSRTADLERVRAALARGARHLWSNG